MRLKRYEEALQASKKSDLSNNPSSHYLNRGIILRGLGRDKEAREAFDTALKLKRPDVSAKVRAELADMDAKK